MPVDTTRRSLVALGLATAAGLSAAHPAQAVTAAAFAGQSGEPHSGRFLLGLLATDNESELRGVVGAVRKATKYFRVLRSRSTDSHKLAFAIQMLDYLAGQKATRFTALEISLPAWPKQGEARDAMLRRIATELFSTAPDAAAIRLVDNGDASNFGHLYAAVGGTNRPVAYGVIGSDDLLQLAGFLTGLANGSSPAKAQSTKAVLVAHLKSRLGVGDISARTLDQHPLFRVRRLQL